MLPLTRKKMNFYFINKSEKMTASRKNFLTASIIMATSPSALRTVVGNDTFHLILRLICKKLNGQAHDFEYILASFGKFLRN